MYKRSSGGKQQPLYQKSGEPEPISALLKQVPTNDRMLYLNLEIEGLTTNPQFGS